MSFFILFLFFHKKASYVRLYMLFTWILYTVHLCRSKYVTLYSKLRRPLFYISALVLAIYQFAWSCTNILPTHESRIRVSDTCSWFCSRNRFILSFNTNRLSDAASSLSTWCINTLQGCIQIVDSSIDINSPIQAVINKNSYQ